jgi:F420-dependent oxidoreductase-like protein
MELGLQIADFTWAGGIGEIRPKLAEAARTAEAAGATRISVMDHFWQISVVGPPEREMLEGHAVLSFVAAHTEKVLLHCLVAGMLYREPAIMAKTITTLDVLSNGRAGLGIGAGWNEEESRGLGIPFPSTSERFEKLEEGIQICLQMWSGDDGPYDGKHYQLGRTLSSPANISSPRPYLMIGGSGERKTLRMVAQYADAANFAGPNSPHLLDVLKQHCENLGRDYNQIEKTTLVRVDPSTTADELIANVLAQAATGFGVTYVWGNGFDDPRRVADLLAAAIPAVEQA